MISQYPKDLVPEFFNGTAETYEKVASWATFGKDKQWKEIILSKIVQAETILELACGTGILTRKLASKFPKASIKGVDITRNYLNIAKRNSVSFENISYVCQDAEKMNLDEKFDCICSSYIPKYCNPEILIKNCILHLNPNGIIIFHDFVYPTNYMVKGFWNIHFIILNLVGNFVPAWKKAFEELPKLIRASDWVHTYQIELEQNGFDVEIQYLTWNSSAILTTAPKHS